MYSWSNEILVKVIVKKGKSIHKKCTKRDKQLHHLRTLSNITQRYAMDRFELSGIDFKLIISILKRRKPGILQFRFK